MRRARTWKRKLLLWGGGVFALFMAVSIVVHIPAVQRSVGGCPFGHDKVRTAAATAQRTGPLAPARPALGFTLAATTRDEVQAWARTNGVECAAKRKGHMLECVAGDDTTWFELDDRGVLVTVKTARRRSAATNVAAAFTVIESLLRFTIGEPTTVVGSTDDLAKGAFQQATIEHEFADYRAQIRATNMGNGYILTESYAAL